MKTATNRSTARAYRWKTVAVEAAGVFLFAYFALRIANEAIPGSIEQIWRQLFGA